MDRVLNSPLSAKQQLCGVPLDVERRGIFRAQPNIHVGVFLRK